MFFIAKDFKYLYAVCKGRKVFNIQLSKETDDT